MRFSIGVGWCIPGESGPTEEHVAQVREALQRIGRISDAAKDDRIASRVQSLESKEVPTKLAKREQARRNLNRTGSRYPHDGQESLPGHHRPISGRGRSESNPPSIRALTARKSGWDPVATGILRYRYVVLLRELIAVLPRMQMFAWV